MDDVKEQPMPKKACMITLMFPIDSNDEAFKAKEVFDQYTEKIKNKRYTFQIVET